MSSDKVKELAEQVNRMSVPELLRMAAALFDRNNHEMALTLADRAVLRMQSKKVFGRDLMEARKK